MRLLIIGVDAATPEILFADEPKVDMPTVESIKRGGIYGILRSVNPCQTGPAWTSFYTGLTPENHGVRERWGRGDRTFADICRDRLPFWYKLTDAGVDVGIFNMPCTYPAINPGGDSYIVSGFPVPDEGTRLYYPPDLKLPEDYVVDIMNEDKRARIPDGEKQSYIQRCLQIESAHLSTFIDVNAAFDVDLAMVQFAILDRLGHRVWTGDDPPFSIWLFYRTIFEVFIPELLDKIKPDNVLILSDHGFRGGGSRGRDEEGIDDHSYNGIFMMYGKDIGAHGEYKHLTGFDARITELANTILSIYGIYPPFALDCKEYVSLDFSDEDESIKEQLEGLGYK